MRNRVRMSGEFTCFERPDLVFVLFLAILIALGAVARLVGLLPLA